MYNLYGETTNGLINITLEDLTDLKEIVSIYPEITLMTLIQTKEKSFLTWKEYKREKFGYDVVLQMKDGEKIIRVIDLDDFYEWFRQKDNYNNFLYLKEIRGLNKGEINENSKTLRK